MLTLPLTSENEVRSRIQELNRTLSALSFKRQTLLDKLSDISTEYLKLFKQKEALERTLIKVQRLKVKEPKLRTGKVRKSTMDLSSMVKNMTLAEVTGLLMRLKEGEVKCNQRA